MGVASDLAAGASANVLLYKPPIFTELLETFDEALVLQLGPASVLLNRIALGQTVLARQTGTSLDHWLG